MRNLRSVPHNRLSEHQHNRFCELGSQGPDVQTFDQSEIEFQPMGDLTSLMRFLSSSTSIILAKHRTRLNNHSNLGSSPPLLGEGSTSIAVQSAVSANPDSMLIPEDLSLFYSLALLTRYYSDKGIIKAQAVFGYLPNNEDITKEVILKLKKHLVEQLKKIGEPSQPAPSCAHDLCQKQHVIKKQFDQEMLKMTETHDRLSRTATSSTPQQETQQITSTFDRWVDVYGPSSGVPELLAFLYGLYRINQQDQQDICFRLIREVEGGNKTKGTLVGCCEPSEKQHTEMVIVRQTNGSYQAVFPSTTPEYATRKFLKGDPVVFNEKQSIPQCHGETHSPCKDKKAGAKVHSYNEHYQHRLFVLTSGTKIEAHETELDYYDTYSKDPEPSKNELVRLAEEAKITLEAALRVRQH